MESPPGDKQPETLFELTHLGAFGVAVGPGAMCAPDTAPESIRRLRFDSAEDYQFVVNPEGSAIAYLKPRDGRYACRAFLDGDRGLVFRQVRREIEHGTGIQTRVRHGAHPGGILGDEESVGVQAGGQSGLVDGIHHPFQAVAAAGIDLPVDLIVSPSKGASAVQIHLRGAEALCHADPLGDILLRHAFHGDKVGTVVHLAVQGPWPAEGRMGQLGGAQDGVLERVAQFLGGTGHHRASGPNNSEAFAGGEAGEAGGKARNLLAVGQEIQRQWADAKGFLDVTLEGKRDRRENEFFHGLRRNRKDLENQTAMFRNHLKDGRSSCVVKRDFQSTFTVSRCRGPHHILTDSN